MNEKEEKEEIKTFPLYAYLLQGQQALSNCKPILLGRSGDVRYTTFLPHPSTQQFFVVGISIRYVHIICLIMNIQPVMLIILIVLMSITKTRLYNFNPLKPHFYIVELGFTGVYIIFLISAEEHKLWVHV